MQEIISLSLFYTTALSLAKNNFLFYFIYRVSKKKIEAFSNKIIPSHMMGDIFFWKKIQSFVDTQYYQVPFLTKIISLPLFYILLGFLAHKNVFTPILCIIRYPGKKKFPHISKPNHFQESSKRQTTLTIIGIKGTTGSSMT